VRLILVALQFLTRVPVRMQAFKPAWLNDCVRHFPLVGVLVGAVGALVLIVAAQFWPAWVAAVLALSSTIALTGGFHEDGLADTFDALGGVVAREKALAIMKDSRLGSYGALALGLSLMLRAALLAELAMRPTALAVSALLASHAFARAAAVGVMVSLPYGGDVDHAKAKPLALAVPPRNFLIALAWCGLLFGTLAVWAQPLGPLLLSLVAAAAVAALMRQWLMRRLGGYTGDGLGATEQLAEIAVLLALTVSL
jgi:adenosylcobinamide-GDP ribazoletransferase